MGAHRDTIDAAPADRVEFAGECGDSNRSTWELHPRQRAPRVPPRVELERGRLRVEVHAFHETAHRVDLAIQGGHADVA